MAVAFAFRMLTAVSFYPIFQLPEALQRFGMSQPAVMMRALNSLLEKDLVYKENGNYQITDVFFKRWIRIYISQAPTLG
jgi:hypothetical protein